MLVKNLKIILNKSNFESKSYDICKEEEACKNLKVNILEYKYNSWCRKYDLVCDRSYMREQGKFVYFVFVTMSNFIIFFLLDRIGRKRSFVLLTGIFVGSCITASFVDNWYLRMALMGAANGCESTLSNIFNVILNETTGYYCF